MLCADCKYFLQWVEHREFFEDCNKWCLPMRLVDFPKKQKHMVGVVECNNFERRYPCTNQPD